MNGAILIQTETSVYLSVANEEVKNLIRSTEDTSADLVMPKVQVVRAEMNTVFYFVVKDSSSQSQSIIELRLNTKEMTHTDRTIFTSTTGDIIALEYYKDDDFSPDGHQLFVVDQQYNVTHLKRSPVDNEPYVLVQKWNLSAVVEFKSSLEWLS